MKIKTRTEQVISTSELDRIVTSTYGRPYCFQQQYGCRSRGREYVTVYNEEEGDYQFDDFPNDTIKEEVNGPEEGVSFKAWLERDPKQPLLNDPSEFSLRLWWHRNFYPTTDMVLQDLHKRGIIDAGNYTIDIDW